jgi:hypothetical protein
VKLTSGEITKLTELRETAAQHRRVTTTPLTVDLRAKPEYHNIRLRDGVITTILI